ncbi:MAG: sigma-70 family RNA polymerase sigma factor [Chloroflexota bacterium]|nr:sigma-70 family RNA polymerase sigma factor [Chloroflexota bacterium]
MDGQRDYRFDDDPVGCAGEAALVAAAQADPTAFGVLYRQYLPQLYRYVRSRLPTDEEAADITQSVFLKALEALPSYQGRGIPFAAWLFRIARNALIDVSRRQRPAVAWQDLPEAQQPEATAQHDALSQFDALIAPLDEHQREILVLRFVVGLPTREIAAIVGKSDGAVRMQLSRSLRTLKEYAHVE